MRLIDADELKAVLDTRDDSGEHYAYQQIKKLIKRQPKVNEWIPVSDKLPDESFEGLEWTMDEDGKPIACDVLVTFVSESENNKRYVTDATYFPGLELSESFTVDDVIAWMPLHAPYKGDRK